MVYYTPEIEEFHVGFECEFKNNMQSNIWKEEVCDIDTLNIAFDSYEHEDEKELFKDTFRVKYLDKEDIESLGWIFDKQHPGLEDMTFFKDNLTLDTDHTKVIRIYEFSESGDLNYFCGVIKNKTEFKKLMKQLDLI